MSDYEYQVENYHDSSASKIEARLNLFGRTGWRLVGITMDDTFIYERPIPMSVSIAPREA